jgi:hypothetical protein
LTHKLCLADPAEAFWRWLSKGFAVGVLQAVQVDATFSTLQGTKVLQVSQSGCSWKHKLSNAGAIDFEQS